MNICHDPLQYLYNYKCAFSDIQVLERSVPTLYNILDLLNEWIVVDHKSDKEVVYDALVKYYEIREVKNLKRKREREGREVYNQCCSNIKTIVDSFASSIDENNYLEGIREERRKLFKERIGFELLILTADIRSVLDRYSTDKYPFLTFAVCKKGRVRRWTFLSPIGYHAEFENVYDVYKYLIRQEKYFREVLYVVLGISRNNSK